jgi:ribose transport system substrate-binding protein
MLKKRVVLLTAIVLCCMFVFAACQSATPAGSSSQAQEPSKTADDSSAAPATSAEPAKAEKMVYGYVTPGPDTWYKKDVEGFQYAANLAGAEVVVLNSDYDVEKEIANIDSLINQGVDGLCMFTFNESGANIAAQKCKEASIPCVVVGNCGVVIDLGHEVVATIDFDWKAMGVDWAEYIAKNFPGENIAMVTGLFEHVPVIQYRSTFEPKVKELGKNEIVAIRDGKYNPEEAVKQTEDLIESGLDFSVLFVGNEDMSAAVIRMLESRGLLNNPIKVITENGSPVGLPLVKEGKINYTISSSPGWDGMIAFLALHSYTTGKSTDINQKIMLPITSVTKETVNDPKKIVPWDPDPVWHELTKEYFPQYDGMY